MYNPFYTSSPHCIRRSHTGSSSSSHFSDPMTGLVSATTGTVEGSLPLPPLPGIRSRQTLRLPSDSPPTPYFLSLHGSRPSKDGTVVVVLVLREVPDSAARPSPTKDSPVGRRVRTRGPDRLRRTCACACVYACVCVRVSATDLKRNPRQKSDAWDLTLLEGRRRRRWTTGVHGRPQDPGRPELHAVVRPCHVHRREVAPDRHGLAHARPRARAPRGRRSLTVQRARAPGWRRVAGRV